MTITNSIQKQILNKLLKTSLLTSSNLSSQLQTNHDQIVKALKSLESKEKVLTTLKKEDSYVLSKEGLQIIEKGSPEFLLYSQVPEEGILKSALEEKLGKNESKIAMSNCMKLKVLMIEKGNNGILIRKNQKKPLVSDKTREDLKMLKDNDFDVSVLGNLEKTVVALLKKRKLLIKESKTIFKVEKGPNFSSDRELSSIITSEMIKSKSWKNLDFKKYNFAAKGAPIASGHLHPLLKVRDEFCQILLEMGFEEMKTDNFVESSFWNFDSLFQPQQHPARNSQDTFFLKNPVSCKLDEKNEYLQKVKKVHEEGGYGSIGWNYNWSVKESKLNILRTHTTACTAQNLYRLAQTKPFQRMKCFSIDRVFRNETLDATHLAEFHQVEGFFADYDLSLGNLIAMVAEFFKRIGMNEIKFKPAYNPYTEPSMEIFGYSKELKKWIEVGNSGMFRPEMLRPMGLPERVNVVAWGLSLERPTMIKYGISNIRDLFGHKIDLNMIKRNSEVFLGK